MCLAPRIRSQGRKKSALKSSTDAMGVSSTECAIRHQPGSSKLVHQPSHCCTHAAAAALAPNPAHQHHHHHHHHHQQPQPQPQPQPHQHHRYCKHKQQSHHPHEDVDSPQHRYNVPTDSNILTPIKSKMKVLKKLKKKIGLAPRSTNAGTNNLPPLTFHQVHGDNIRLCNGNTTARRHESFCKGVTFSARPVRVGEKVCIKFLEISDNWSGVVRFGFTSNDPVNVRNGLPRYACPDLTNKPGYWAKALAERFAGRNTVLFYYVTSAGDVHFGVNGEEKGVFFNGVETRNPLWAVIDVYGNSTAIEFVDPNRQRFNNVRRSAERSNDNNAQHSRHSTMDDVSNASRDIERIIVSTLQNSLQNSLQNISIHCDHDTDLPCLKYQPLGALFTPLPFHPTRGRNIRFSHQQCVATRTDTEFCHGYAFTNRPLVLGERLVVQILSTEPMYVGALALGLTSCNPMHLTVEDLPDDSDLLLDRPEYWVVSKDVASSPQPGDEIAFTVTHYGEVQMSKNGGPPNVVMHVDQSLMLWAFVDVYGSTERVRMFTGRDFSSLSQQRQPQQQQTQQQPQQQQQLQQPQPQQQQNQQPQLQLQQQQPQTPQTTTPAVTTARTAVPGTVADFSRFPELVQFKPAVGGGTVLVVNLPPQGSHPAPPHPTTTQPQYAPANRRAATPRQSSTTPPPPSTGTMASTSSSTYVEPVNCQSTKPGGGQPLSRLMWREGLQPPTPGQPSECSICYERNIDCVLYTCGHMCMCYTCAQQQWRGKGGGHCPLCRAAIRDVIRTYRS